jgi:lysophospholipase L1-like esterase
MRPRVRRYAIVAAIAAAVSLLGLAVAADVRGATGLASPVPRTAAAYAAAARQRVAGPASAAQGRAFSGCEQRLEQAQPRVPRLAVLGASFTAGLGSSPSRSWAVLLARRLHWDAVVYGVPGAGYVRPGASHGGPVVTEVGRVGLPALAPSLIIVQAGHDDIGIPPALERQRVTQAIAVIRAQAPHARLVLLTVFPGRSPLSAAYRTDQAIVGAARAADHAVLIIDPLTGRWTFPHVRDGLHPTAAGSAWIAGQVAAILRDHGVASAPAPAGAGQSPVLCDHASAYGAE